MWRLDQQEPFGDSVPDENPSALGVFQFNARDRGTYFDQETDIAYNWNRYRDQGAGRFMQADPLGLHGGDMSLYVLRKNNPLSYVDPLGLQVAAAVPIPAPQPPTPAPTPAPGVNPPSGGEVIPFPGGRDRPSDRPDRPGSRERESCPVPDRDPLCPFTGMATFDVTGAYSHLLTCYYRCPRKGLKSLSTTVYFESGNPAFLCDPAVPEYYFP